MQQERMELMTVQPDPETFRRVWTRVMEGREEESPIQTDGGGEQAGETPGVEEMPGEAEERTTAPEPAGGEPASSVPARERAQVLAGLLEQARRGTAQARSLSRRGGRLGLQGLAADHRSVLARLEAACFLETGRRPAPVPVRPVPPQPMERELRERFLWEEGWQRACLAAAEELGGGELEELCRELAGEAAFRGRAIRRALERMWGGGT